MKLFGIRKAVNTGFDAVVIKNDRLVFKQDFYGLSSIAEIELESNNIGWVNVRVIFINILLKCTGKYLRTLFGDAYFRVNINKNNGSENALS